MAVIKINKLMKKALPVIPADKSAEFIRKANQNVVSKEFIEMCHKSAQRFKKV